MIAIVLSSISAVLAAIVVFIIVYYAIETRRQGFKIFWQKLEYFSSVISVDEEKVSFRPRGKDISNGQLDNIGLVGRTDRRDAIARFDPGAGRGRAVDRRHHLDERTGLLGDLDTEALELAAGL
ncbi:MAG: hypothetical protein CL713_02725, partial [Chloroflexi bacterium]|nr:hypothetical protein [Chloroflexota bacterium]